MGERGALRLIQPPFALPNALENHPLLFRCRGYTLSHEGHEDEEVELRKQAMAFRSYLSTHKETAATQGVFGRSKSTS